jgi:AraC-like DNA-binding protein
LGIVAGLDLFSLLIAVLVAWTLSLCALWGKDYTSKTSRDERKYGGRPLSADMADELVRRTRALLVSERDLSSPDVAPRQLAGRLGEPYHLLSRAVNEREGISISDLISEYRVDRAKGMLEAEPDLTILDIALDSGFQAKSTFNEVFKKRVGMSPRRYRSGRETSSH